MTAQLSIFPVTASMDTATAGEAPLGNNSADGATNPFTQLLQGMVATLDGQEQQQSLPLFPGISVKTALTEQGNSLPQQGQTLASDLLPGQYLNPLMSLNQVDVEAITATLEFDADVLAGKARPAIPAQLANVLQQLVDNNAASSTKPGQLPLNLSDLTTAQGNLLDLNQGHKTDQIMAAMTARLSGAVENIASNKAESTSATSQFATQILNNSLSSSTTLSAATSARTETLPVMNVPPQHPGWSQAVGERVQWMVSQQMQKAEIRLDPPELGSLEVRVVVQKDNAQVSFAAPNAQVRDAIEAAIPRLREMLSEQGLDLANVDVGQHSFAEQREQNTADEFASQSSQGTESTDVTNDIEEEVISSVSTAGNGLLDTYV